MSDNDAVFEALAVLAKQCRDLEARLAHQEVVNADHHARLSAHALLIERLRNPGSQPLRLWRPEAA